MILFCSDDESTTATEDEDDIRARELRKQEVWLKNPTRSSDTDSGSETEVKISQDSVDNVTQESLVLPVQTSNLMLPQVTNTNNSETVIDQNNSTDSKDIKNVSIIETLSTDPSMSSTDQQACGSIIPITKPSFCVISNNIMNSDSPLVCSDPLNVQNNLNGNDNPDKCISKNENIVKESIPSDVNKTQELLNESPSPVPNIVDDKLTKEIIINNIEVNDKVTPDLGITSPETIVTLNTELQTAFAGIMLPDAIPFRQISYNNTVQPNTEESTTFREKLPDLVTSSPKQSRESSPSSSEIYKSTETLYDELYTLPLQDKISTEGLETGESDNIEKCDTTENNNLSQKENKFKLHIKDIERIPILTITSPSPTSEKSLDEPSVEVSKLTIPKEVPNQAVQSDENSSFDKLKRDLRQRKARNKIPVGELRPLSTENARQKMNKYFTEQKKQKTEKRYVPSQGKKSPDIQVVELDIKPKVSAKVETKDIMKYFNKTKPESPKKVKTIEEDERLKNEHSVNNNIDELNKINVSDIDSIDKQFEQIELLNEKICYIDTEDIESKLHLNTPSPKLYLENMYEENSNSNNNNNNPQVLNEDKIDMFNFSKKVNIEETIVPQLNENTLENKLHGERQNISNNENNDRQTIFNPQINGNHSETQLHEKKAGIIVCSPENSPSINRIVLAAQSQNNNLETKFHEQKANVLTRSRENIKNDITETMLMPQLNKIKITDSKSNALHASDSTLNVRKGIIYGTDLSHKNSRSSSELTSSPTEYEKITKVNVIEKNIEVPRQINNSLIALDTLEDAPKRPERKHGSQNLSSSRPNVSSTQFVPEVPVRTKCAKRKPSTATLESTNVQSSSITNNERLIVQDTVSDKHNNTISTGTRDLEHSHKITNNDSEISKTPDNTSVEQKHPHPIKSHPLTKSDQRGSSTTIASKNEKSKKDKCVIS